MFRPSPTAWPMLVLTVFLVGCDSGSNGSEEPVEPDPVVRLLDGGEAPLANLAYRVATATEQQVKVTVLLAMSVRVGEDDIPAQEIPPIRTTLDLEVLESRADDAFDFRFTIADTEIIGHGSDLERLAGINRDMTDQDPTGLAGTSTRSARGHVRAVDFGIPSGARTTLRHYFGNLRQALLELAVPVPEEEVGVGARWHSTRQVKIIRLKATEGNEYRLVSLEDGGARIALSSAIMSQPQPFLLPSMPSDAKCELTSMSADASGELTVDPKLPLPVAADLRYVFDLRLRFQTDSRTPPQDAAARVEMRIQIEE